MTLTQRPKRRTQEERDVRFLVLGRYGGACEACGAARAVEFSHRVGEKQGGPYTASNSCGLCRRCHRWCHRNPKRAQRLGWHVHSSRDPETRAVYLFTQAYGRTWVLLADDGSVTPCDFPALPDAADWLPDFEDAA